jgi:acid stress-induced BolA-like protein IbaG/YrbA
VTVEESGCGAKVDFVIASSKFEGLSLLDRQRAVNAVMLPDVESGRIHAMTMKTWTEAQLRKNRPTAG